MDSANTIMLFGFNWSEHMRGLDLKRGFHVLFAHSRHGFRLLESDFGKKCNGSRFGHVWTMRQTCNACGRLREKGVDAVGRPYRWGMGGESYEDFRPERICVDEFMFKTRVGLVKLRDYTTSAQPALTPLSEIVVTATHLKGKEAVKVYFMTMEDAVEKEIHTRGCYGVSSKRPLAHMKAVDELMKKKGCQLIKEREGDIVTVETTKGNMINIVDALLLWVIISTFVLARSNSSMVKPKAPRQGSNPRIEALKGETREDNRLAKERLMQVFEINAGGLGEAKVMLHDFHPGLWKELGDLEEKSSRINEHPRWFGYKYHVLKEGIPTEIRQPRVVNLYNIMTRAEPTLPRPNEAQVRAEVDRAHVEGATKGQRGVMSHVEEEEARRSLERELAVAREAKFGKGRWCEASSCGG
ncbi:hypothetical protein ACLOJK_027936 [Asimina triloba]